MNNTLSKYELLALDHETTDCNELIGFLANNLCEKGFVKNTFRDSIIQREEKFPTGIQMEDIGIAIPHTDCNQVISPVVTVTYLNKPIKFKNMEDPKSSLGVNLVFLLALNSSTAHLEILSDLTKLLQDKKIREEILSSHSSIQVVELMRGCLEI